MQTFAAAPEMLEALENLENDNGQSYVKGTWNLVENSQQFKAKGNYET